jgi:hypothetical protein
VVAGGPPRDQPDRRIVITRTGHRDHAAGRASSRGTLAVA